MKAGDFVYVNYVGKVKGAEEIFDLTDEKVAKEKNIYNEKFKYRPVPLIIDSNFMIRGLNEALKKMEVGEKKTIAIEPADGFGDRKTELIKIIPEARFKEQNIDANPGTVVNISGVRGRIMSMDGGRVRVDFNHPLAGKILEYDLEITSQITDDTEKLFALVNYFVGAEKEDVDLAIANGIAEIKIKKEAEITHDIKQMIANNAMKWIGVIKKVRFIDEFENK
jgi:FKBP-type peptidyl-prolyl cis-trans isomerase 2